MSELATSLLLGVLIGLAILARGFLQPRLAAPITALAATGVAAYVALVVAPNALPWLRSLVSEADGLAAAEGAERDATPDVGAGALRLEASEQAGVFRVLRGSELVGELSRSTLDQALGRDPELDEARFRWYNEGTGSPDGSPTAPSDLDEPADPAGDELAEVDPRAERESVTPPARRPPSPPARERDDPDGPDREELKLRARAGVLAVESACAAADLLETGQDPRTIALRMELRVRCRGAR